MDEEQNINPIPEPAQKILRDVQSKFAQSAEGFKRRNRVTIETIFLMLLVALFYDITRSGLDLIPFIGWLLSPFVGLYSWLTFYVWTSMKGWGGSQTVQKGVVNVLQNKKFLIWAAKWLPVLGVIPILNFGPDTTASVILSILVVKSDDFIYNKTKGKLDVENINEGLAFFNLFRDVYNTEGKGSYRNQPAVGKKPSQASPAKATDTGIRRIPLQSVNYEATKAPKQPRQTTGGDIHSLVDKEKKSGKSAGSEQEIESLKSDMNRWKNEVQQLERELLEKQRRLTEEERSSSEAIKTLRESGRADGAREGELEERARQISMPLFRETTSIQNRINRLKDSVWSGNNKLLDLERKSKEQDMAEAA